MAHITPIIIQPFRILTPGVQTSMNSTTIVLGSRTLQRVLWGLGRVLVGGSMGNNGKENGSYYNRV